MNYVIAALSGTIGFLVANAFGLPFWPEVAIWTIGYLGGRIAGHFAKD